MTLPPAPSGWTIDLVNAERLEAVAAFGFTERQARFLLNVLLHSGVFEAGRLAEFWRHFGDGEGLRRKDQWLEQLNWR